jgi:very-short-patch-repair endonuclease
MSTDDFYYHAAHDIGYWDFNVVSKHPAFTEDYRKLVLRRYTCAWEDFLLLHELTHSEARAAQSLVPTVQRPEFESPIERLFWEEWQRQGGSATLDLAYQYRPANTPYRVDFAHVSTKTAVELDGYEYHSSKEQFTHDRKRQRELERLGWRFIRFSGSELMRNPEACFSEALDFVHRASGSESVDFPDPPPSNPVKSRYRPRFRDEIVERLEQFEKGALSSALPPEDSLVLDEVYQMAAADISFMNMLFMENMSMQTISRYHQVQAEWISAIMEVERQQASYD